MMTIFLACCIAVSVTMFGSVAEANDKLLREWSSKMKAAGEMPLIVEYEMDVVNGTSYQSVKHFAWRYVDITNARKGGKCYTDFKGYENDRGDQPREKTYAFNGTTTLLIETVPGLNTIDTSASNAFVNIRNGADDSVVDYEYYFLYTALRNVHADADRLLELRGIGRDAWWLPDSVATYRSTGSAVAGGKECVVFQSKDGTDMLWIDPTEKILRQRVLTWPSGAKRVEVWYSDHTLVNDVAFPQKVVWKIYASEVTEPEHSGKLVSTMSLTVGRIVSGSSVKDTLFDELDIPKNTAVYDERTGENYIYEGNQLAKTLETSIINSDEKSSLLFWVTSVVLVSVLAIGLVVIVKRVKNV